MTDTDHAMAANQYSKYTDCMEEIKRRTEVVNCFLTRKCHAMYVQTTAESVSLQIRKILELIVLASLAANRSEYAKLQKELSKKTGRRTAYSKPSKRQIQGSIQHRTDK